MFSDHVFSGFYFFFFGQVRTATVPAPRPTVSIATVTARVPRGRVCVTTTGRAPRVPRVLPAGQGQSAQCTSELV